MRLHYSSKVTQWSSGQGSGGGCRGRDRREGKVPEVAVACRAPCLLCPPDKGSATGTALLARHLQGQSPYGSSGLLPLSSHPTAPDLTLALVGLTLRGQAPSVSSLHSCYQPWVPQALGGEWARSTGQKRSSIYH